MRETAKPDDTDRKIMNLLHTNARMPVAEIGRHISMTQPAVRERIQKLEEQGIITAYKAKFDPGKLDWAYRHLCCLKPSNAGSLFVIANLPRRLPSCIG